jgi:glutaminyl-tRNA synthetase
VTPEEITAAVDKLFEENSAAIKEQEHGFNFGVFQNRMKDTYKWADGGLVKNAIDKKKLDVCGEALAKSDIKKVKAKAVAKPATVVEETKEEEELTFDITKLVSRDMDAGNSSELLEKHRAFTGGRVITRFPPEPNGYLHIGHAKSIRFNFTLGSEYKGETYLRFDDTNPCKENNEFIDHIKDITRLGSRTYQKGTRLRLLPEG